MFLFVHSFYTKPISISFSGSVSQMGKLLHMEKMAKEIFDMLNNKVNKKRSEDLPIYWSSWTWIRRNHDKNATLFLFLVSVVLFDFLVQLWFLIRLSKWSCTSFQLNPNLLWSKAFLIMWSRIAGLVLIKSAASLWFPNNKSTSQPKLTSSSLLIGNSWSTNRRIRIMKSADDSNWEHKCHSLINYLKPDNNSNFPQINSTHTRMLCKSFL